MRMHKTWMISGITTVAIVAVGIAVNRNGEQAKEDVRQPDRSGQTPDPLVADPVLTTLQRTKRVAPPEPVEEAVAQVEISEVTVVAAASSAAKAEGRLKNPEENAREAELAAQIAKLAPRQVAGFIDSVSTSPELADDDKAWWIFLGLQNLFAADRKGAFKLLGVHSQLLLANRGTKQGLNHIIGNIGATGRGEDLALLEQFVLDHPEFTDKEATVAAVMQAGHSDIARAFQLLRKNAATLGDSETKKLVHDLSDRAVNPEASLTVLNEVRNWPELKEGPGEYGSPRAWAVRSAANRVLENGFESSAEWFQQAKLDGEETRVFAMAIGHGNAGDELGKWLNWTGENAPRESFPEAERDEWWEHIRDEIEEWVEDDPEKVSQWLESQAPGEVRDGAIVGYARTIQEDHPDEAAEWVKLMRKEENQQTMLNQIYREASFDSPADAKAFAEKHGIRLEQ